MTSKKGFTLVEVLVSVTLTGLIASLAFAPVVYAVRRVMDTEAAYSDETALRRAAMFMAQDAAAALRLASTSVRVVAHQELGGGHDDTLIVASSAQAKQNLAAGSVIYRVVRRSFMDDEYLPGLYRWLLPGVLPEDAAHDRLETEDGQLVAPYVTELNVSVLNPSEPEWLSDYSGALPSGMRLALSRDENGVEYVCGFPK